MSQNQLTESKNKLKSLIQSDNFRAELGKTLPRHLSPDRFARIAITALTRTPKLAECTQASLFKCLLDLSSAGLEPDGRRAHLIPYGKECTLVIDYKGLVELIRRSGDVTSVRAETVCENDEFDWVNGEVTHRVNWRQPRGKIQAVYAEARMKSGEIQTATMTVDEVEAIRKRSQASNSGPWVTDWGEMAKKTAVRRLSKMLPLASEVSEAIDRVDQPLEGSMRNVTPADESVFDQAFSAEPEEAAPETGSATGTRPAKKAAKKAAKGGSATRTTISKERVNEITERLLDENRSDRWFIGLVAETYPDCPAKELSELTDNEADAGLALWPNPESESGAEGGDAQ